MAFSTDIVPEQKFTLASLFGPADLTTTTTHATFSPTKAKLSCCSSVALPIVTLSQNGDTANAKASASNTTNNSTSSSISNVKNIVPTHEKRHQQGHEKQNLQSILSGIKIWKKPEIKSFFPIMTKQTTIDQSNVIGTGEEGLIVSKVTSKR
jgi:hypothetical protein